MCPLDRKRPLPTACTSACAEICPPAASISVRVGSSGSIAKLPRGLRIPRRSGRWGWTSTTSGVRPARSRARAIASTTSGMPPVWSPCQWETNSTEISDRSMPRRSALPSHTSPEGPTSNKTVAASSQRGARARAEKPWHAMQRCAKTATMSCPSWLPMVGPPSRWSHSASCGMPSGMVEGVSVALSTTTVTSSSSSSTVSSAGPGGTAPWFAVTTRCARCAHVRRVRAGVHLRRLRERAGGITAAATRWTPTRATGATPPDVRRPRRPSYQALRQPQPRELIGVEGRDLGDRPAGDTQDVDRQRQVCLLVFVPEVEGDGRLPVRGGGDAAQAGHAHEAVLDPALHHRVEADIETRRGRHRATDVVSQHRGEHVDVGGDAGVGEPPYQLARPGMLLASGPVLPLAGKVLAQAGAGPLQRTVHGVDGVAKEVRDVLRGPDEHVAQDQDS